MTATLLHRLDSLRGDAQLIATDRDALRSATFLDGRERFWRSERIVTLDEIEPLPVRPSRYIFHVGFCGSTLLSRLVDQPGQVLSLREPQALTDLSSQRGAILRGDALESFDRLADRIASSLAEAAIPEIAVVKPSSWVNGMLDRFCTRDRVSNAVFLTMDRRSFIRAAFRGGRERLAYCARLAADMATTHDRGASLLGEATGGSSDPLDQMARLAALLHAMQEQAFEQVMRQRDWPGECLLDYSALMAQRPEALKRVRVLLNLPDAEPTSDAVLSHHSKDPARDFSSKHQADQDAEVERHHAARFGAAMDWIAQAI